MCCEPQGAVGEPDGVCPDCGADTVEGSSTEVCGYSPRSTECETCGDNPCQDYC